MSRSAPSRILALAVCTLLVLGGAAAWWFLRTPVQHAPAIEPPATRPEVQAPAVPSNVELETRPAPKPVASLATTVLWPLRVELELVRPAYLALGADLRPLGADKSARLAGRIGMTDDAPAPRATVRFVAGTNQGRELACDVEGRFGANDLAPGINVVEISGSGISGARREVLLRQGSTAELNLGFGRPAACFGTVIDKEGKPVVGAEARIDFQTALTDEQGVFYLANLCPGRSVIEIHKAGFAAVRQDLGLTAGYTNPVGQLTFKLKLAASLIVSLKGDVGADQPVDVLLLPAESRTERTFPWHRINPIAVRPGSPVRIDDLPPGVVTVRAFRPGALAEAEPNVLLREGEVQSAELTLAPASEIVGRVLLDGKPQAGVPIELQAADGVNATLEYAKRPIWFLESEVMPLLSPARQKAVSDAEGRFVFTSWSAIAPLRYLEARTVDGRYFAHKLVKRDDDKIELHLSPSDDGKGSLRLMLDARTQGLPCELYVNGQPRDPWVLGPDDDLVVDKLVEGIWSAKITYHYEPVYTEAEIDVKGETRRPIDLPQEAIDGHTPEEWKRAGRVYPGS
ncbi:MAG: carboxypeptidase regulatory-like domain-containing protein [Planctomycetota bacterium]|nr:MAG: carboxypeptidase regulatory-like domain-containing protein [Planctomycetota bacterium]